jgi:hypothetical protein
MKEPKYEGSFLFWFWEEWRIGGVAWFFLDMEINPGRFNPIWLIYYLQRGKR